MSIENLLLSVLGAALTALIIGFVAGRARVVRSLTKNLGLEYECAFEADITNVVGRVSGLIRSLRESNDTIADLLFPMWEDALRNNEAYQTGEIRLEVFTDGFRRTFLVTHRDDPKDALTLESGVPPMFEFAVDLETGELSERSFRSGERRLLPGIKWAGMVERYHTLKELGAPESKVQFLPRRA